MYIGTIHPNHAALSIQIMNAGKHVLCEKPMAMNRKQAKKVFEAARQNGVFFMEVCCVIILFSRHCLLLKIAAVISL